MLNLFDVAPTRQQLIDADNVGHAWVCDSYLMCNGIQGLSTEHDRKTYMWFNQVIELKRQMTGEGYNFRVDRV